MDSTASCHATSTNGGLPNAPHPSYVSPTVHGPAAKGKTDPNLSMGNYCLLCHGTKPNTFDGGFVALLYGGKGNCSACHPDATAHPTNWVSTRTGNTGVYHNDGTITEGIKSASCALCHTTNGATPPSPFTGAPTCFNATFNGLACHASGPGGAPHVIPYIDPSLHGPAAKADLVYCQGCHADTGTASNFGVAGSNPRFDVPKPGMPNGCETCHPVGAAHPTGTDRWTFNYDGVDATRRTHFASGNVATACVLCHDVNGTNNGGTAPLCTSCHATTSPFTLNCNACHETPPATGSPNFTGATLVNHAVGTDVSTISNHQDCSICHGASEDGNAPGTLLAKSADYQLFSGTGQGGDHLDGLMEVNSDVGYQNATATVVADRFGCAAACHPNDSGHQLSGSGLVTESGHYTAGSVSCSDCHGYPPNTTPAPGATSASHMLSDSGVSLLANHGECQTCHGTKDSGSGSHVPLANYTPATNHYNGLINMNSATNYNATNGGCDTAVCHGNDTNHRVPPTSGLSVQFGNYGTGSCTTCHDYPPKGDKIPLTAPANTTPVSHMKADLGASLLANHGDCQTCHGTRDTSGVHDPVSPYDPATMHRDGQIQMNSDTGYNPTNHGCDNAGCHGNDAAHQLSSAAPGLTVAPIALGVAGACDTCHGGLPTDANPIATNAHSAHITNPIGVSVTCNVCHGHNGSGSTHRNGTVNVPLDSGLAVGGLYTPATKQCSNIYCHGRTKTFDWDAGVAALCGSCHGAPGTGRPNNVNEPSGGNHMSTTHAAQGCTTCHPHDGIDTVNHINGPASTNADAQISTAGAITSHSYGAGIGSSPDPDGFKYSSSTCSSNNAACHGTAVWGTSGGCNFCHGYPPTSSGPNNKHALGTTPVNHDFLRGNTTSIGTGLTANHDQCSYCHGVKDSGPGTMVALAPTVLGGTYTYVPGTDHKDGNVTMNGPSPATGAGYNPTTGACDNAVCHTNNAAHSLGSGNIVRARNFGPGKCSSCHFAGNTLGAPEVTGSSTHVKTTLAGSFNACEDCHSGHVGSARATIELPSNNWTNATGETHVNGDMQAALGIDYTNHNGINLGGPGTVASINSKGTEAEICWGCHDASGSGVTSELNGGGKTYKFGTLSTSQTNTASHVSDWTTAGAWRIDAYDSRLTRPIASVHTVNMNGTAGHSSSVANNVVGNKVKRGGLTMPGNASGQNNTSPVVLENKQYIRCSYCHDVHSLNKATGDVGTAAPYLRGTWLSDPYPEDHPPAINQNYGTSTAYVYNSKQTNGMPRAKSTAVAAGGFFIDQNSGNPTAVVANNSVAKTASLCTLCHGTNVNAMNFYTTTNLWVGSNGHANSTLGGTGTGKVNLFDATRGGSWYMAMQGSKGLNSKINSTTPPWGSTLRPSQPKSTRNSGWYGGTVGSTTRGADYSNWYSTSGIGSHTGSTGGKAHDFTCSKCHSPHATGLPALLKTNCLDTGLANYTNSTNSAVTFSAPQSNNCHRKTATETGWNTLAPRQ